jgi:ankyrin repeat protein
MFKAIESGDSRLLGEIISADPEAARARNEQGLSAILYATYMNRAELVDALISTGVSLDVWEAAATGRFERLRELVLDDPSLVDSPSADGFFPLGYAAFFGHEDSARFLLAAGAGVDVPSRNALKVAPLHSAVASRHREIVRLLLDHGANPNSREQLGHTPLHSAAFSGDMDITMLLLAAGADPTLTSDEGKTAAMIAREKGNVKVAELLEARNR